MASQIKGIVIEIGADTKPLEKALEGVKKKSNDIQAELRQVDRLLKLDPKNTELLEQKQKLLTEAVSNTKDKLGTLKEAESQVQEQFAKGNIAEGQYKAIQREVIATEQNLKSLEDRLKNVNSNWKGIGEGLQNVGSKTTSVGKGMSVGITAPIVAIGTASMAAFNEVDAGLDTIVTKTGATGEAMDGLQEAFNNVYANIPADAQAVGDAIGEVSKQFDLTGKALEDTSAYAIKFSQITGQDVTSAITDSKAAMEAFGLAAGDVPVIMDSVAKTAQNTGVATDQLFAAVIKGAPQLQSMGLDFAQSAEMIGRFEQKGLDSEKALSYLTKAQVTWAKEGKTMSEGLEELVGKIQSSSSETDKLSLASEAFGTKGAAFMMDAIQRGALSFDDLSSAADTAAGTVSTTFEGTLDPVDQATVAMNNLKIAGNDLAVSIQEAAAPILEKLVEILQSLAQWFGSLPDGVKQTIVIFGGLLAAIGPVIVIIGTLISSVGSIITFFAAGGAGATAFGAVIGALTGPIGIAIGAITAIIAVGVLLYKNWDEIKAKASELWSSITSTFEKIKSSISDKINGAKDVVGNAIEKIKDFFDFEWELPKLKLPHFSIKGEFSLSPPSVPKLAVDWYKTGAVFTKPSVIGVGESGSEAVIPINQLSRIIVDTIGRMDNSQYNSTQLIEVTSPVYLDGKVIASVVSKYQSGDIRDKSRGRGIKL